ncbi:glutamate ABC transporter substrate-binding protein [Streptomyces iconiensis]|uniref:Glutamate ABC transporter substrate-binding protein n=1 Tax=Streptomyces iconiensis TaxID=1384038 RepID=A0ABT6ZW15_9ACTN|nr:glutamate ABC transporter substrate-binding protein [Streptomyces iconiensis]MDJ1132806.1 glutamate ABC transporter substrate-binding protein [Streptomyces iconiensis]
MPELRHRTPRRAGTPPTARVRGARTRAVVRAAVLLAALGSALGATGCGKEGSPPARGPQPGKLPRYTVDTGFALPGSPTWQRAKKRGRLTIGVKEDQPGMGEMNPATGVYSGFDVEIANMVAASLGFDPDKDVTYKAIASANRETALQNGQIDYYVGTYTINDGRKKLVGFAGPYYIAGQKLLVRADEEGLRGPQDMAGRKICSAVGSTPLQRIEADHPEAVSVAYDSYAICVDNLLNNQVDAVTTDDTILLGYAAKDPEKLRVVGKAFSEEPYGIGVPREDTELAQALDTAITAHEKNGDWKRAYDVTLGLSGVPAPPPPRIDRSLTS